MTQKLRSISFRVTLAALAAMFVLLVSPGATAVHAQQYTPPGELLSPDQLDDLVAPIALYPDPLISQVLVATTYPLEVVEAHQWMLRNPNLKGLSLTQAARNQDWDTSVQALVLFPDVLKYLTEDIAWTTNLGNAFLAQESDVMDAIQRMRDKASRSGKLRTTSEQRVTREYDSGRTVYVIVPTNPDVIYVPVYDPYWIWGTPIYYPYARWYYPPHSPYLYFNSGIYVDFYFGSGWRLSGWSGWNSWGWRPAWNTRTVIVNNVFIDNHYYNSSRPRNVITTTTWSHDVVHRRGVVYPTTTYYDRYRRDTRDYSRPRDSQQQSRSVPAQAVARNSGSLSTPRQNERQGVRPDARTDSRSDVRQDSRPASRPDTRVAGRDATPNSANRDSRSSSDLRNDRGNSNQGQSRSNSTPAQGATSRPSAPAASVSPAQGRSQDRPLARQSEPSRSSPAQAAPSRPAAPAPSPAQGRSQDRPLAREGQTSRNVGSPMARLEPPSTPRVSTASRPPERQQQVAPARSVPQQQASVRQAAPARSAAPSQPSVRQSEPSRQAPSVRSSAPSQSASSNSHASSSSGRSDRGSDNGGNSKGRR